VADELKPKHRRFVLEYLKDSNASAAYLRAGFKSKNPDVNGPRLLGNAGIKAAIAKATANQEKRLELSADRVLTGILNIAEQGEVEANRLGAYSWLGKALKLFTDKTELVAGEGVDISIALGKKDKK
jgi:phage terminase small subunit